MEWRLHSTHLGDVALAQGDLVAARMHLERSLRLNHDLHELAGTAFTLARFAELAAAQHQAAQALRLAGAAAALRDRVEMVLPPEAERRQRERLEPARRTMGPRAEAIFDSGRGLSVDAAVAEALTSASEPAESPVDPLSPREREVVALIGRGYTNRRIAEELVIGEARWRRTSSTFWASSQLASRTQIAVWVERQQPNATREPNLRPESSMPLFLDSHILPGGRRQSTTHYARRPTRATSPSRTNTACAI